MYLNSSDKSKRFVSHNMKFSMSSFHLRKILYNVFKIFDKINTNWLWQIELFKNLSLIKIFQYANDLLSESNVLNWSKESQILNVSGAPTSTDVRCEMTNLKFCTLFITTNDMKLSWMQAQILNDLLSVRKIQENSF